MGQGTQSVAEAVFELDGKKIHLIDTPGIDFSTRVKEDLWMPVTSWLAAAYGIARVDNAIYTHRIGNDAFYAPLPKLFVIFKRRV